MSSCYLFAQAPQKTIEMGDGLTLYWYDKKGNSPNRTKDQALVRTNDKGEEELICAVNDSSIIKEGGISAQGWPCKSFFGTDTICGFVAIDAELFDLNKNIYIFKKTINRWELKNKYLKVTSILDASFIYNICFLSQNIISITYEESMNRPDEIVLLKEDNTIERYFEERLPAIPTPPNPKH